MTHVPRLALAAAVIGTAAVTSSCALIGGDCGPFGRTITMDQVSMENTIRAGDVLVVVNAIQYVRGDVVVFPDPTGGRAQFVKRVIGLPGETVELRDGIVVVNGAPLPEPYIYDEFEQPVVTEGCEGFDDCRSTWQLEAGELLVFGDHRRQSVDSRVYGPIKQSAVSGRVTTRCTPRPGPIH